MQPTAMLRWGIACSLVLACLGCGDSAKKRTVPVEGKVLLEGAPVEGATVTFEPITSGGHRAHGLTGKDGSFRLSSFSTGDGAGPGRYKVIVVKKKAVSSDASGLDPSKMGGDYTKIMKSMTAGPGVKGKPIPIAGGSSEVHANYGDNNRTPLTETVPEEGNKSVVIPLKKDGT